MCATITAPNQEFKSKPEEVLKLEFYLDSLYKEVHPKERTRMPKSTRRSNRGKQIEYNDGNLSDELDAELGLTNV